MTLSFLQLTRGILDMTNIYLLLLQRLLSRSSVQLPCRIDLQVRAEAQSLTKCSLAVLYHRLEEYHHYSRSWGQRRRVNVA